MEEWTSKKVKNLNQTRKMKIWYGLGFWIGEGGKEKAARRLDP